MLWVTRQLSSKWWFRRKLLPSYRSTIFSSGLQRPLWGPTSTNRTRRKDMEVLRAQDCSCILYIYTPSIGQDSVSWLYVMVQWSLPQTLFLVIETWSSGFSLCIIEYYSYFPQCLAWHWYGCKTQCGEWAMVLEMWLPALYDHGHVTQYEPQSLSGEWWGESQRYECKSAPPHLPGSKDWQLFA